METVGFVESKKSPAEPEPTRAAVGHRCAMRRRLREFTRYPTNVARGDPATLLGPLGGVLLGLDDVLLQLGERDVRPALPEARVVEPLLQDDVDHRIGNAAVRAGHDHV